MISPKLRPLTSHGTLFFLLPCLSLASAIAAAYLAPALTALWTSDDYALVPHLSGRPVGSFWSYMTRSESGTLTPHRLFLYSVVGPLGSRLSTPGTHLFAILAHLLCALLAYGLGRRLLRLPPLFALIGTLAFAIAPWATQPVIWWSSVCTILSTVLILLAAHLFLSHLRAKRRCLRLGFLAGAASTAFLSLCLYDLWIAGWLTFAAIAFLEQPPASLYHRLRHSLRCSLPMVLPFALWVMLVFFIGPRHNMGDRLALDLFRIPVVLLSLHARIIHWFVDKHQIELFLYGLRSPSFLFFSCMLSVSTISALACAATGKRFSTKETSNTISLSGQILTVWSIFLSSRLSMILQGGVALHSRLSYGAALAAGMAFSCILFWLYRRCQTTGRQLMLGSTSIILIIMSILTLGRATHYADVTIAELQTLSLPALSNTNPLAEQENVIVVGTPVPAIGELNYFSEGPGTWLRWNLQQRRKNNVNVRMLHDIKSPTEGGLTLQWDEGELSTRLPKEPW